jgi:plastocyanin
MHSLLLSLAAGAATLALLAAPPAANAQMRALPMSPRVTFNGATHTRPFPSTVFVPPRINASTIQSNFNHWAFGGYPNLASASLFNTSLAYRRFYNPYAAYAYNPYLTYAYNPYLLYGGYGGYGGGYGGYGGGYGSYQSQDMYGGGGYGAMASPDAYTPTGTLQSGRLVDVGVYDNRFEPISITIKAGATVRWTNYDTQFHTVTSDDGLWDSGQISPGSSHSYTFSKPGTYKYHCSDHPRMTGTVIVQ